MKTNIVLIILLAVYLVTNYVIENKSSKIEMTPSDNIEIYLPTEASEGEYYEITNASTEENHREEIKALVDILDALDAHKRQRVRNMNLGG